MIGLDSSFIAQSGLVYSKNKSINQSINQVELGESSLLNNEYAKKPTGALACVLDVM